MSTPSWWLHHLSFQFGVESAVYIEIALATQENMISIFFYSFWIWKELFSHCRSDTAFKFTEQVFGPLEQRGGLPLTCQHPSCMPQLFAVPAAAGPVASPSCDSRGEVWVGVGGYESEAWQRFTKKQALPETLGIVTQCALTVLYISFKAHEHTLFVTFPRICFSVPCMCL